MRRSLPRVSSLFPLFVFALPFVVGTSKCERDADAQIAALCKATEKAACDARKACSCDATGITCDTHQKACEEALGERFGAELEAGRARISESTAARCAKSYDAVGKTCAIEDAPPTWLGAPRSTVPAACDRVIVDVAKVGDACKTELGGSVFCADGDGICSFGPTGSRTCVSLPKAGDTCADGSFCATDLRCDGVTGLCVAPAKAGTACNDEAGCASGLVCRLDGKCGAKASVGSACNRAAQCVAGATCSAGRCVSAAPLGGACSSAAACGEDRACVTTSYEKVCRLPAKVGEACGGLSCETGAYCDSVRGTCAPLAKIGEDCSTGAPCVDGAACPDGEPRVCQKLPGEGEACFMGGTFCATGLGCDEATMLCARPGGVGSKCLMNPPVANYVCGAGLVCGFTPDGSLCVEPAKVGSKCGEDKPCVADAWCNGDTCLARGAVGASCSDDTGCRTGLTCKLTTGGSGKCAEQPKLGESCQSSCAGGLACAPRDGTCASEVCVVR